MEDGLLCFFVLQQQKSLFYKNVQAIRKIVLVLGTLYQIEFVLLLEESY